MLVSLDDRPKNQILISRPAVKDKRLSYLYHFIIFILILGETKIMFFGKENLELMWQLMSFYSYLHP